MVMIIYEHQALCVVKIQGRLSVVSSLVSISNIVYRDCLQPQSTKGSQRWPNDITKWPVCILCEILTELHATHVLN